jgi:dTDP-4-amino-4,6-dideoxygalactose transaminase
MKFSRQIIYPINYFSILKDFFKSKKNILAKDTLLQIMMKILNYKKNCLFIGRARTGIFLAIKMFLDTSRPKVIMSPFTIPDVVNMVICAGGIPMFVDFEKKTTFINVNQLQSFFKENKSSILILTHYNINEKNYLIIKNLCDQYNIKLIEDCAISMGGRSDTENIGSLCDLAIYSFSSFKFINFFWGGLIYVKNDEIFKKFHELTKSWKSLSFKDYLFPLVNCLKFDLVTSRLLFSFFIFNFLKINLNNKKNLFEKKYTDFKIGELNHTYYSLPSDAFFHELCRKINNFIFFQEKRVNNSLTYYHLLNKISIPYNISKDSILNSSCYNYLIYSKNKKILRSKLIKEGFDTGYSMYQNCHKFFAYKKFEGYSNEVENLIENSIVLPTHYLITKNYAEKLSNSILSNYS